jgi:hypothetical protein
MSARAVCALSLLLAAIAAGTMSDVGEPTISRELNGYHVLAADLHVHSFPLAWSTLSPWDTVIEARRQGLDVIAMTPHNRVWPARVGRWFSQGIGGPMVIVGEEIVSARFHLIAVGTNEVVSPRLPAAAAIDEVHRQGGVAIAAHPYDWSWPAYDAEALRELDGAEIVRPEAQHDETLASQLGEFFGRAQLTAIGSSDYHGLGPLGYCRTYVFVRDRSEQGVIEAIREGRTVVYDRERAYGDPALIRAVSDLGGLPHEIPEVPAPGAGRLFSRIAGLLALTALLFFNRW